MALVGSVVVGMSADTKTFQRDMSGAIKAVEKFSRGAAEKVDAGMGRLQKSVEQTSRRVNTLLKFDAIRTFAGPVLDLFKSMVGGASDLGETQSKVNTVFGDATKTVEAQADRMAKAFGLPKKEMLDAAASIGLVGKAAGQSQGDAAIMANQPRQARRRRQLVLQRAPRGGPRQDPLRPGGRGGAAPRVRRPAQRGQRRPGGDALGLSKTGKDLTEQSKVMARASLITKGLADATGDLERTQSSTSNMIRKLEGSFQNAGAALGKEMLPFVNEGLKSVDSLGQSAARLKPLFSVAMEVAAGGVKALTWTVELLAKALTPVMGMLDRLLPEGADIADSLKGNDVGK